MDTEITEDELVAALFSAQLLGERVAGALTSRELAKKVGRSIQWVRDQLRSLIDDGQVEPCEVSIVDIANRKKIAPAYSLKVRNSDNRSGTTV